MKFLKRCLVGLLAVCLSALAQADEVDAKNSIEARYAYTMGYRVGQSLLAHGINQLSEASLKAGMNALINHQTSRFEQLQQAAPSQRSAEDEAYLTGYRLAQSLRAQDVRRIEVDSLVEGVMHPLDHHRPRMTELELNDALNSYFEYHRQVMKRDAEGNLAQAEQFLKRNAMQSGVQHLPSGLQFKVLRSASGDQPSENDTVVVNYRGKFADGEVFDSSDKHGGSARFALHNVIPGFREALTNMHIGEQWRIFVHPDLGYGRAGVRGMVGANELLIFDMELLQIAGR